MRILSRIPSWSVAVAGAAVVLVATVISAVWQHQVTTAKVQHLSDASSLREQAEALWGNHLQGDQRATAANLFVALAQISVVVSPEGKIGQFALDNASTQLRGAVASMSAASNEVEDETPTDVQAAEAALRRGDSSAYSVLTEKVDQLRLTSMIEINKIANAARDGELRARSLDAKQMFIYSAYAMLNLIGLGLVVCKDLPVWRRAEG